MSWIAHQLASLWHFLTRVPQDVFGRNLMHTGLGIAAAMCFTATVLAFAIGAWQSLDQWAKAADAKWDEAKIDADNELPENRGDQYVIDWRKAREQQVVSWQFTLPFGALVLASLAVLLWGSFTYWGYFTLAALWFAFAPLLRRWWIRTLVHVNRSLNKHDLLVAGEMIVQGTPRQIFRYYVAWGLSRKSVKRERRIFRYRFRKFNFLFRLFRFDWIRLTMIKAILICLFYALIFPVAMTIAVFKLTETVLTARTNTLKPDWASGNFDTSPPSAAGLVTIKQHPMPKPQSGSADGTPQE